MQPKDLQTLALTWLARVLSIAAVTPILMIAFGEHGTGPADVRGWLYLALFPFAFSAAYLLAWRFPLAGGIASLVCMAASLTLIGRTLPWQPYAFWAGLCVPGILFIIVGLRKRQSLLTSNPGAPPCPAPASKTLSPS